MRAALTLAAALAIARAAHDQIVPPQSGPNPVIREYEFGIQQLGSVEGAWRGTVEVVSATDSTPAQFWHRGDRPELMLSVRKGSATLEINGTELQVGDGFRVKRYNPSALLYAVQSAGNWVEQWSLSITKKDSDTLVVFVSFVAGGRLDRIEQVANEFAVGAVGELVRVEVGADEKKP